MNHIDLLEFRVGDESREEVRSRITIPVASCSQNESNFHFQGLPEARGDVGTNCGKVIIRGIEIGKVLLAQRIKIEVRGELKLIARCGNRFLFERAGTLTNGVIESRDIGERSHTGWTREATSVRRICRALG